MWLLKCFKRFKQEISYEEQKQIINQNINEPLIKRVISELRKHNIKIPVDDFGRYNFVIQTTPQGCNEIILPNGRLIYRPYNNSSMSDKDILPASMMKWSYEESEAE